MIVTSKRILIFIAVVALGAFGLTLVSQHYFRLMPCAWCILQRLIDLAIAIICLLAAYADAVVGPKVSALLRKLGSALTVLLGIGGILAAAYQNTVTAKQLTCSPTFAEQLIAATGLDVALPSIFGIYTLCTHTTVKILGLEYSVWSLILFGGLTALGAVALFKRSE